MGKFKNASMTNGQWTETISGEWNSGKGRLEVTKGIRAPIKLGEGYTITDSGKGPSHPPTGNYRCTSGDSGTKLFWFQNK